VGIRVRKIVAVGHLVHKYGEFICSNHQGGHPASHHDPPVGGPVVLAKDPHHGSG